MPGGQRGGVAGKGHHISGKQVERAVVVDVAEVDAHGAVAGGCERLGKLPAVFSLQPGAVGHGEVVGNKNIGQAVAVEIVQGKGQCLGSGLQDAGREAAVIIAVVDETAAAVEQEGGAAVGEEAGVVGGRNEIEVAVGVEVGPVEDGRGRAMPGSGSLENSPSPRLRQWLTAPRRV